MKNSPQHVVCRYQLSDKLSQFNRLHITEEILHVSHCFFTIVDTTLVMNLIIKLENCLWLSLIITPLGLSSIKIAWQMTYNYSLSPREVLGRQ